VHALAARHPRLADLSFAFPALLAALAAPRPSFDPEPAVGAVIAGAPLVEIARPARVPLWLRRLRAELVPRRMPELPDSTLFRREIGNHMPRSAKLAPLWLRTVADAAAWGHEPFAIWCARELLRGGKKFKPHRLRLISLWACSPWLRVHVLTS
jgi:hypothetical protein